MSDIFDKNLLFIIISLRLATKLLSFNPFVREVLEVDMQIGAHWYFTGLLEVAGGIGLLISRYAFYAAGLPAVIMVGAIIANLAVLGISPVLPRYAARAQRDQPLVTQGSNFTSKDPIRTKRYVHYFRKSRQHTGLDSAVPTAGSVSTSVH
jgi:hypothetical protein